MTSTNVRFVVDDRDMIVDRLNDANSGLIRACIDGYEPVDDEADLREQVLCHHLGTICRDLLFPKKPDEQETYAILGLITASHLNTFPPQLSLEQPFAGQLNRPPSSACGASESVPLHHCTTLGFFVGDVERLLLDLYGNVDREVLGGVLGDVRAVALMNLKYLRPDLWSEDEYTKELDLFMDKGVHEDLQPFYSNRHRAINAFWDLKRHLCMARNDYENFGPYTHRFIQWLYVHWPELSSSDFSEDLLQRAAP